VRLLDTIKAPGSPGHLSWPFDKGKVVSRLCESMENEPAVATASRSGASAKWETTERGL
jgi:hypothetical protein